MIEDVNFKKIRVQTTEKTQLLKFFVQLNLKLLVW